MLLPIRHSGHTHRNYTFDQLESLTMTDGRVSITAGFCKSEFGGTKVPLQLPHHLGGLGGRER